MTAVMLELATSRSEHNVLGWDLSGVVEKVGPAVTWFKPGDQVYGYIRRHHLQYGTYAEYATAPEGFFAHMPPELSFEEAAAPELHGGRLVDSGRPQDPVGVRVEVLATDREPIALAEVVVLADVLDVAPGAVQLHSQLIDAGTLRSPEIVDALPHASSGKLLRKDVGSREE